MTLCIWSASELKPRKRIDTHISTPLFNLPLGAIADGSNPTSLPQRNLLRHVTWQLPSGQRIAKEMDVPSLASNDLSELSGYGLGLERNTPLPILVGWGEYLLAEANARGLAEPVLRGGEGPEGWLIQPAPWDEILSQGIRTGRISLT